MPARPEPAGDVADVLASAPLGDLDDLDRLLSDAGVVLVVGPGGVGKTTMAASMAIRAAQVHGRRALVVTVDPARRLADALGVANLTEEPVLVPVGPSGLLWALMIDMARSWDRLVTATSPDPATADGLLANGLYRTLTRRFIQSHDYIALDHLVTLGDDPRYDLVIVDTPPSRHAIDLVDAPGRMIEFFDSRLLRWLTFGSGFSAAAARPFLAVAERLLGRRFLTDIMEFFTLFARLRSRFVARARSVEERLSAPGTSYVVVSTADEEVAANCDELTTELATRGRRPDLVLVNRLLPTLDLGPVGSGTRLVSPPDLDRAREAIDDPDLALAVERLVAQADRARLPAACVDTATVAVPLSVAELTDVEGLARLLGG